MINLINRIAWFVSFAMGFLITFSVGLMFDMLDDRYSFDDSTFMFWMIGVVVFGSLFKKLFFAKSYILFAMGKKEAEIVGKKKEESIERAEKVERPEREEKIEEPTVEKFSEPMTSESMPIAGSDKAEISDESQRRKENSVEEEIEKYETKEERLAEEPRGPNFIQKFFAENMLAKVGGILLFLAVLFLLQLVYTVIGPIGKLMIGFLVGFVIFGVGVFIDGKGYKKESGILMGTAILINYLVILSGRYLIGEELFADKTILNESMTFLLLIVNTVFAITVSIAYNSHALLFFSFVVAYLNPFLVGMKMTLTFFNSLSYALFVSFGAVLLSYYYRNKNKIYSYGLLSIAFFGGNILILTTPFSSTVEWLVKLGAMAILSLLCIVVAYRSKNSDLIGSYFMGLYMFFIGLLFYGNYELGNLFSSSSIMIGYLLFMVISVIGGAFLFASTSIISVFYILLLPIFILLGLMYSGVLYVMDIGLVLTGTIILYLSIFVKLTSRMLIQMKYLIFAVLGVFIFLVSDYIGEAMRSKAMVDADVEIQAYGVIAATFIFLIFSYYFSSKKSLEYLYTLGTIFSMVALLPVIERAGSLKMISVISIVLLMAINIATPFINKALLLSRVRNLALGLVSGVVFATFEIFYFWYGDADQSKITIGLAILMLAVLYFFVSFAMHNRIKRYRESQVVEEGRTVSLGAFHALIGASISLFSLSVAYIFSESSEVISAIWLFESSLLYYFYGKTKDVKIYIFAFILMVVGLVKLSTLLGAVQSREYTSLISLFIIFWSFVASLKFLNSEKKEIRSLHDFGHMVGIFLTAWMLIEIIPDYWFGWYILGLSIFGVLLSLVYSRLYTGKIKYFYILFLSAIFVVQIFSLETFFAKADAVDMSYVRVAQYLSTVLLGMAYYIFNYLQKVFNQENNDRNLSYALTIIFSLYLFIITSQYVFFLFNENEFVLTIYWGVISFVFLNIGIQKDIIRLRTIGLYILSLTTIKILLYDIWSGLDDAIVRVIALMIVGGIMIAVSTIYSKKYGGNLKGEFDLENLKNKFPNNPKE